MDGFRCEWNDELIKRAVLWLCEKTDKALLKLDDNDFRTTTCTNCCDITVGVPGRTPCLRRMMNTINYHPAGKESKRVICFSPHPDDDVISMGGNIDSPESGSAQCPHRLHD